jgi:hypothetical protein
LSGISHSGEFPGLANSHDPVLKVFFSLDCCVECNAALVAEHFTEGEMYENANIYVRKITEEHSTEDIQAILEVQYTGLIRRCSVAKLAIATGHAMHIFNDLH